MTANRNLISMMKTVTCAERRLITVLKGVQPAEGGTKSRRVRLKPRRQAERKKEGESVLKVTKMRRSAVAVW